MARPDNPMMSESNGGELEARFLQDLLQAVDLAGAFLDLLFAIPCEIPQIANRHRRHKTAAQQPVLQQLGNPRAVLHVRFPTGHMLEVLGVDEQHGEPILQHVEDRLPVDPRALHRDVRHRQALKPVTQSQQVRRRGAKRVSDHLASPRPVRDPRRGHHAPFVHVQSCAPFQHPVHKRPPCATARRSCSGENLLGVLTATIRGASSSRVPLTADSVHAKISTTSLEQWRRETTPIFILRGDPQGHGH